MRSLAAFVLLGGIGVGLFVYLPTPVDREATPVNAERAWNAASRSIRPSKISAASRSFSPKFELTNRKSQAPNHAERSTLSTVKGVDAAVASPTPKLRTTVAGWQPVVVDAAGTIAAGAGAASLKPKDPTSRYKLVVKIQRKLKKRGCYWGRIDGSWGTGSKRAMQAFIDRINAALSVQDPDYVVLALLQANSDKTCGGCTTGQTLTVGGSCVPQTAIAATQHGSDNGGQGSARVFSWKLTGEPQPAAQPLLRPVGTPIATTAPLPGSMAIGGPQQLPSTESNNQFNSVAAVTIDGSNDSRLSQPSITGTRDARRARAARRARTSRREAKRSRRRNRGARAARRRNLLLGLGGAY
jgi:hypothetical protein